MRKPASAEAATLALSAALGIAAVDARQRVAPEAPTPLARLADERAAEIAASLRAAGVAVVDVPADGGASGAALDVRTIALGERGVSLAPRAGAPLDLPFGDLAVVLRAASAERTAVETTSTTKQLAVGRALLSGGLMMRKATTVTSKTVEEATEQSLFIASRGGHVAVIREHGADFSSLGAAMQVSRVANMTHLAATLRARAPSALHDDRLLRLGRRASPMIGGELSLSGTAASARATTSSASALVVLVEAVRVGVASGLFP